MSLSPFYSFQSRFVTYLLNRLSYFVRPPQALTCGTFAIIIRVVYRPHICAFVVFLRLPFITINHAAYIYIYIDKRQQYICLI